jgi:hypothetical protein
MVELAVNPASEIALWAAFGSSPLIAGIGEVFAGRRQPVHLLKHAIDLLQPAIPVAGMGEDFKGTYPKGNAPAQRLGGNVNDCRDLSGGVSHIQRPKQGEASPRRRRG